MRRRLRSFFHWLLRKTADPPIDQRTLINKLNTALTDLATRDDAARSAYIERVAELHEARQMAGSGPWNVPASVLQKTDQMIQNAIQSFNQPLAVREAGFCRPGTNDLERSLNSAEWRRELMTSSLEFSRWGLVQIMLICRLYFMKNPWIRRGVNLSAAYVFGQGVELSSPDPAANEVLRDFREHNRVTLGQIALTELEKRKAYDGNIFWCLFADTQNTGKVSLRVIETTEISEIVCNPNDADEPWFYKREWSARRFDIDKGVTQTETARRWYPALNYEPAEKVQTIGDIPVQWDAPIYHRKVGHVASWLFGCPRAYPAIDYAREGRLHLKACANVTSALSEIAVHFITKGGQQAISDIRQELVRPPSSSMADLEDDGRKGALFFSGPGTKIEALKTRGAGAHPEEVKEYRNMAACALEIPPTWLGDMETSNLSTAQTLDRPTELGFLLKQEEWQEDLTVMAIYALKTSRGAVSGRLREALVNGTQPEVSIREAVRVPRRTRAGNTTWQYEAAKIRQPGVIEVLCNFPAIREGDIPALVTATVQSMTLGTQSVIGIDQKAGVRKLFDLLGIDDGDQIVEEMYPAPQYEMKRAAIEPAAPGALPAPDGSLGALQENARIGAALARVRVALGVRENGHAAHS